MKILQIIILIGLFLPFTILSQGIGIVESPIILDETEIVKRQIIKISKDHGVNSDMAMDLARKESQFEIEVWNREGSTARGVYQFINSTWNDICVDRLGYKDRVDSKDNIGCAMELISQGDIFHWTADMRTRDMLIKKGYVVCGEGKNNCILSSNYVALN